MDSTDVRCSSRRRQNRRLIRRIVVLGTCLALVLSGGLPSAVVSGGHGDGFPLPSLWNWSKGRTDVWSGKAFAGLPTQRDGGRPAGGAQAGGDSTRDGRGAGRPAGQGIGALAPERAAQQTKQYTTGKAIGGKGAFDEHTSKRVAKDATAVTDVFANTDGSFTRRVYDQPTNFRAADGTWQPIVHDLNLGAGDRYVERAGAGDRDFARRATDPHLVTVRYGKRAISYGLQGAADVTGAVQGNSVTYAGVRPDVDLVLSSGAQGVKEKLVLRKPGTGNSWVFPLDLDGLGATLTPGGAVELRDPAGAVVATIPAAWMEDAKFDPKKGSFTHSDAVHYVLTTVEGRPALQVTADQAWLDDPARVYPVTIDPTVESYGDTGDTFVSESDVRDHSAYTYLNAGTGGPGDRQNAFLQFANFDRYYAGISISSATLNLHMYWSTMCEPSMVTVHKVTEPWSVTGAKTYPGPAFDRDDIIGWAEPDPKFTCHNDANDKGIGVWVEVPIWTAVVNQWTNGSGNYGLAVTADDENNLEFKRFTSRDYTCCAPYLDITYSNNLRPQMNEQRPSTGFVSTTLTPYLLAYASDPEVSPLTCKFLVFNGTGDKISESPDGQGCGWTVPSGVMRWGETYLWTVIASDPGGLSTEGQTFNTISTPVPQPLLTNALNPNDERGFDPDTRNYTLAANDATVATVGPALTVRRQYNSLDPRPASAFGAGWSTFVDMSATEVSTTGRDGVDTVVVRYPTGQDLAFARNGDGSYTPPPGRFATLTPVAGGGYRFTDKDGTAYQFSAASATPRSWRIQSVTDANGRAMAFTYPSAGAPAGKVTAASGRALYLTWTTPPGASAPHIAEVATDPVTPGDPASAQRWTYGYAGDQLTKACPPTSATACTTYGYGDTSVFAPTMLSAGPSGYWRLGESGGTGAANAVQDYQGLYDGRYTDVALGTPGPIAASTGTAATFNGTSSTVEIATRDGGVHAQKAVSLWFKAAPGDSGPLWSWGRESVVPGEAWYPYYHPGLYVGESGHLYGTLYEKGDYEPIASAGTVNDGQWHQVVLTDYDTGYAMYLDGALAGTKLNSEAWDDNVGLQTIGGSFIGDYWPDKPWQYDSQTGPWFFKGSISDVAFLERNVSAAQVSQLYRAGSRPTKVLTSVVRPSGGTGAVIAYNPLNGAVTKVTDGHGGDWHIAEPQVVGGSQTYKKVIIDQDPGHYLRMQETGATTAIDERQVSFEDSVYSSVTLGTPGGPFDDATVAGFNGNSSYISLADSTRPTFNLPEHTNSLWFRMNQGSTAGGVLFGSQNKAIGTTADTYIPWLYVGTDGKLRAAYHTPAGNNQITTPGTVNDGQWHQVATTGDEDDLTLFLDGAQIGATVHTTMELPDGYFSYLGTGTWTGWPGADPGQPAGYFPGAMAEFATFSDALTPADIQAQFQARSRSMGTRTRTSVVTDPAGGTLTYQFDSVTGRKLGEIDALGHRTAYGYDTAGQLRTTTDPNGHVTTNEHDVRGNIVSTATCQDQAGNHCSTVYYTYYPDATTKVMSPDPRNDVLLSVRDGRSASATDPAYLTSFTYDAKGNRKVARDPLGRETTTAWTDGTTVAARDGGLAPPGLPMTLTTAGGAVQRVVYFHNGDVAEVTDPAGKVTRLGYDPLGRLTSRTETTDTYPSGLTTTIGYDRLDRPVTQTEPAVTDRITGAVHTPVTTITYNDDGQQLTQTLTDTTGGDAPRTATITYDPHGRQASTTDPSGRTMTFGYDIHGNVVLETDADGGQVRTGYDAAGRPTSTTLLAYTGDPNAPSPARDLVTEARSYDPAGRLATVTDAMGWVTAYAYTDNNLTAKVTRRDPSTGAAFVTQDTTYDAAGNVVSQTTGNGSSRTDFVVDAAGRTSSSTLDPAGLKRTVTYGYSLDDHVTDTKVTDAAGTVVGHSTGEYNPLGVLTAQNVDVGGGRPASRSTYTVDQGGLVTASTDPLGNTTNFTYDEAGRLAVTTGPAVSTETGGGAPVSTRPVTRTGFNTFGETVEQQDAGGSVVVQTYDAAGRAKNTTMPSYTPPGATTPITPSTSRVYDGLGQLTEQTDPLGKKTTYAYDGLSRLSKVTAPDGGVSTFTYDLLGDQLSTTDPTGAVQTATYDYLGHAVTTTAVVRQDETSYTTTMTYGPDGRLAGTRTPAGVTNSATYNAAGEIVTTTDGAGQTTHLDYDGAGRPVRATLPDGTYTTTAYDLAGHPTGTAAHSAAGTVLASGGTGYDAAGRPTTTTDARGTTTTYAYDAAGLLTSSTQPTSTAVADDITVTFGYDQAGNRSRFTDGRGNAFLTTYNPWGQPESMVEPATATHPAAADRTFTMVYDAAGRAQTLHAPGGVTTTNEYDDAGNVITQSGTGAEAATVTRQFDYDLAGRVTGFTAPGGANTVTYDDRGGLRSTHGPSGDATFTYRPDGQLATRTDAAGATTYGYDTAGRLSTVDNPATDVRFTVGYDDMSQVRSLTYGGTGNVRSLGYDDLHRLATDELRTPGGTTIARIAYGFDPAGNETAKTTTGFAGASTNTYTYDLANRLTSWDNGIATTAYAYDKSGNRTTNGSRTFAYDQRNRLTSGGGSSYAYTARGTLATTTTAAGAQVTAADAFGQVVSQQAGGPAVTYGYDAAGRVARPGFAYSGTGNTLAADGTETYTRGPADELLGVAAGGARTAAWTDLHTDVVALFTATGTALSGSTAYDPLGRALAQTGAQADLGYESGWTDTTTGRVNMAARWYNPDTGQFDTRDSADVGAVPNSVAANRYQYGDGNPLTVTDPTGHWGLDSLRNAATSAWNGAVSVYNTVKTAVVDAGRWVMDKATTFVNDVRGGIDRTIDRARDAWQDTKRAIDQGRQWVAQKYEETRQAAAEKYEQAKQAGERALAAASRAVDRSVNNLKDAYNQAEQWAKDHKDLLIEIAAVGAGVLAGLACGAITFGVGAVACMVGAGALVNLAKDAAEGNIHNWGDAFGSMGTGAVTGLMGAFGGFVGAKVAGALASKLGGSLLGRIATGAIAGGVGDAVTQFVTTGHVDWTGVAMSAAIGGATGGRSKRPASGAHAEEAPPARRPAGHSESEPAGRPAGHSESEPSRGPSGQEDSPAPSRESCASGGNSFDPATGVRLADGTSKPIAEVKVGDSILAADPATGETAARTVTATHVNHDTALTNLTIGTGDGVATVKTTAHHLFWSATRSDWVPARDLRPGEQVETASGGPAVVLAIDSVAGEADRYDLTVDGFHTYYVLAADTPVLVHNCGGGVNANGASCSCSRRQPRADPGFVYRGGTHAGLQVPGPRGP